MREGGMEEREEEEEEGVLKNGQTCSAGSREG